jgi:hypothetical protein
MFWCAEASIRECARLFCPFQGRGHAFAYRASSLDVICSMVAATSCPLTCLHGPLAGGEPSGTRINKLDTIQPRRSSGFQLVVMGLRRVVDVDALLSRAGSIGPHGRQSAGQKSPDRVSKSGSKPPREPEHERSEARGTKAPVGRAV